LSAQLFKPYVSITPEAIQSLFGSVKAKPVAGLERSAKNPLGLRRFRDATIKAQCKSDYPHALQALWKALDRAEDLIKC
jgi:hypothetical protein